MGIKFAFGKAGKNLLGQVYRPIAKVSFKSPYNNIWTDTWMVVDTGADFTILPRYLSQDLNISLERDCIKDVTIGVGGRQVIYLYKDRVKAKIVNLLREVPLAFLDSNEVPALLGRLGFLETFDTEFLKTHVFVFKN